MTTTSDEILERQARRFAYLKFLYDDAQRGRAGTLQKTPSDAPEKALGLSEDEASRIADYLSELGLVKYITFGTISITVYGINYVEEALARPERPTEHFPAVNYLHIDQVINSQVQQGTAHSSQHGEWAGLSGDQLRLLIAELKPLLDQRLTDEQRADAESNLATLEAQATASRPSKVIVREALGTLRGIAEKVGASLIAATIIKALGMAAGG